MPHLVVRMLNTIFEVVTDIQKSVTCKIHVTSDIDIFYTSVVREDCIAGCT